MKDFLFGKDLRPLVRACCDLCSHGARTYPYLRKCLLKRVCAYCYIPVSNMHLLSIDLRKNHGHTEISRNTPAMAGLEHIHPPYVAL